jgi:hypothetical protein
MGRDALNAQRRAALPAGEFDPIRKLAQKAVHRADNGDLLRARAAVIIARVRPINRGRQLFGTIRALLALVLDQREDLLFDLS